MIHGQIYTCASRKYDEMLRAVHESDSLKRDIEACERHVGNLRHGTAGAKGNGIWSNATIPAKTVVGLYTGRLSVSRAGNYLDRYSIQLEFFDPNASGGNGSDVYMLLKGDRGRGWPPRQMRVQYINHRCKDFNCDVVSEQVSDGDGNDTVGYLKVVTRREIAKDEELTYNYSGRAVRSLKDCQKIIKDLAAKGRPAYFQKCLCNGRKCDSGKGFVVLGKKSGDESVASEGPNRSASAGPIVFSPDSSRSRSSSRRAARLSGFEGVSPIARHGASPAAELSRMGTSGEATDSSIDFSVDSPQRSLEFSSDSFRRTTRSLQSSGSLVLSPSSQSNPVLDPVSPAVGPKSSPVSRRKSSPVSRRSLAGSKRSAAGSKRSAAGSERSATQQSVERIRKRVRPCQKTPPQSVERIRKRVRPCPKTP